MWHNSRFLNYIAINCYARDKKHSFKTLLQRKQNISALCRKVPKLLSNAGSCRINMLCYHHRTLNGWEIYHFHTKLYKYWTVSQTPNIFFHVLCLKGWRLADEHCTGHRPTRTPTFLGVSRTEFQRLPFSEVPKHYVKKSQLLSIR